MMRRWFLFIPPTYYVHSPAPPHLFAGFPSGVFVEDVPTNLSENPREYSLLEVILLTVKELYINEGCRVGTHHRCKLFCISALLKREHRFLEFFILYFIYFISD